MDQWADLESMQLEVVLSNVAFVNFYVNVRNPRALLVRRKDGHELMIFLRRIPPIYQGNHP